MYLEWMNEVMEHYASFPLNGLKKTAIAEFVEEENKICTRG